MPPFASTTHVGLIQVLAPMGYFLRSLAILAIVASLSARANFTAPLHSNRPHAVLGHPASDPRFDFRGVWEGELQGYNAGSYTDSAGFPMRFRIVIGNWRVSVFNLVEGQWHEMKPGAFRMRTSGPHALIYSTTSGSDGGVWIESSTFTLAHAGPGEVVAYWQRTVNNLDSPATDQWHQFAWGYSGTLRRSSAGG